MLLLAVLSFLFYLALKLDIQRTCGYAFSANETGFAFDVFNEERRWCHNKIFTSSIEGPVLKQVSMHFRHILSEI